ncbi:uncharacterized protein BO87DRAFT_421880 [Aspergillus neoniger CBS 115656]|uniref:Uncharacterized protein n=1 Tax=Aspergillus neoniger (strain CBS 115656) TaxID=1448310 RepID=A0A318YXQ9_ASPNB|nr:hypothetical protein BO87DRAFT_421880 [Aspergillus neoniger CBS 115656]PYH38767.1 hypothetical protein BO87DRAFT_421880 [Aspergillus neoniger CBS 115656]
MKSILNKKPGSINDLENEIKEHQADIVGYQAIIDHDRFEQEMTAAYVWIPLVGTIAATVIFAQLQEEINIYESKIEAMNKLIKDAEASKQVHKTLQANVTFMKSQAKELSDLIDPAKQAIETLEGGWDVMGTEVQYIHDKANDFNEKIPRMTLSKTKLNSISKEWYKLNKYASSYIEKSQLVPAVQIQSLDDYLQELKDVAIKSS